MDKMEVMAHVDKWMVSYALDPDTITVTLTEFEAKQAIEQAIDKAAAYDAMVEAGPVRYETFNGTTWIKSLHNVGGELLERALYALEKGR